MSQYLTSDEAVTAYNADSSLAPVAILDGTGGVTAQISGLEAMALAGKIISINLTNAETSFLELGANQLSSSQDALTLIQGPYRLLLHGAAAHVDIAPNV